MLILCCGNKKGGIWLEILLLVVLAIVLPIVNSAALNVYSAFIIRFGAAKSMANSVVSLIASFCCYSADLGQTLAYITCGMSIAFKAMNKKQNFQL